jgi:hypothetical protein
MYVLLLHMLLLCLYICYYICVYLEAAVATVFEIATFPLAKVLHSRSIENVFSVFEKKKSKKKMSKKRQK